MGNNFATIPFSGQALSPVNPQSVRLPSGAIFNIPVGNFVFRLGPQTALQFFDYYSGQWRIYEAGSTNWPIEVASDGTNYRAINLSGTIVGAKVTTAGTAYTQVGTTVSFAAPVSGGITATGTPIIGGSLSLTVTGGNAGTGYTDPVFLIPPPQLLGGTVGLCLPATATVAVSAGVLGAITLSFAGAGYVTAPTGTVTATPAQYAANPAFYNNSPSITIIDPTGSGANIIASITNGTAASGGLTGILVNNTGSLYDGTHIPAVTITCAGSSATAAATALPNMSLTGVTLGGTNTGYTASVIGVTSLDVAGTPQSINGEGAMPRAARFVCTQSGGVLQAAGIEDAGSGFQTVPLAKQTGNATADGSVNATFTAVVGGVTNTLIFWQVG